ncbi:cyclic pyranopterin phosphate synthase [Lachnospiraceae bacterium PF1-21]
MRDQYNREIEYMRVSVTDRCNMRCLYCMPRGVMKGAHQDILTYEEILRICEAGVLLGIKKYKITGGEPLARKDCPDFIRRLKSLSGVEQVTLTTNGIFLDEHLDDLKQSSIDGINISIDSLDEKRYRQITGTNLSTVKGIIKVLERGVELGIKMKVNAVLLKENRPDIIKLASLAREYPVDVRFIELMPIGEGALLKGPQMDPALNILKERWPDLQATPEKTGNGPAHYYTSASLQGKIGFIDAISHRFCDECNRIRLTSLGMLKPCLCYEAGTDLRSLLRAGASTSELAEAMKACIYGKPRAHSFQEKEQITEYRRMNEIGG